MIKNWRWFISKTLRDAVELHKQVIKLLAAQCDLLKPSRVDELEKALDALQAKLIGPVDKAAMLDEMDAMMIIADRVLLPYPDPKARDWVEMFLVVAVLVLAFRTFFFQPFKIPTGSMQPTLYGITIENLKDHTGIGEVEQGTLTATEPTFQPQDLGRTITFANDNQATITQFQNSQQVKLTPATDEGEQKFTVNVSFHLPGNAGKAADKLRGYSYHSMQAEGNWQLIQINPPKSVFPLITKQTLVFRDLDTLKTLEKSEWFPPLDSHQNPVLGSAPGPEGQPRILNEYSKGDFIYKMRVKTGDHLFVNRITFNFRRPRRGDICVFSTKGVPVSEDPKALEQFYIKRLVAFGGESISIGRDRHIKINGRRVDSNDPGFEFLYDFPIEFEIVDGQVVAFPTQSATDSVFSGHVNNSHPGNLARLFPNYQSVLKIKPQHYLMFGDNTTSSSDSRTWGELPMRNVIGKSSFVYWPPLSPRFGWSHR